MHRGAFRWKEDIAQGEYFGELALFDDKPRSASALDTTDAVLLELSRAPCRRISNVARWRAMAILRTGRAVARDQCPVVGAGAKNAVKELRRV